MQSLTLSQFLHDRNFTQAQILSEMRRLHKVMCKEAPITILSQPTREWARDRNKI